MVLNLVLLVAGITIFILLLQYIYGKLENFWLGKKVIGAYNTLKPGGAFIFTILVALCCIGFFFKTFIDFIADIFHAIASIF